MICSVTSFLGARTTKFTRLLERTSEMGLGGRQVLSQVGDMTISATFLKP